MAVLLFAYGVSMAYATFLENDYGTPTAKALIYEAKWFELLMLLLIVNFCGNIWRYRLWRKEKLPVLIFHLAFILIFIGGAITRYISFEGVMHIREGETTNEIVTDKHFFKIQIEEKGDVLSYQDVPYIMSPKHKDFRATYDYHGKKIVVKALDYVQRKKDSLLADPAGEEYLHFVYAGQNGRVNYYLKNGESKSLNGTLVTFNRPIEGAIEFKNENGQILIKTPVDAEYMTMATQAKGATQKEIFQPLALRSLYTINDIRIVVPDGIKKGKLLAFEGDKKKDKNLADQLTVELQGPKSKVNVNLEVEKGNPKLYKQISIDGLNIMLGYGPKIYNTPFAVQLKDFVMETYPGSSSPSAYESNVNIIDEGKQTPHKIYMNNVLDYKGYRFFQSGFDPDRQGTILSVNHDYWGTLITYTGYFFLFTAMFVIFFWKGTHFWKLNTMLKDISKKKSTLILVFLLYSFAFNAQKIETHGTTDGSRSHTQNTTKGNQHTHDDGTVHSEDEMSTEIAPHNQSSNQEKTVAKSFSRMRNISADEAIANTKISEEHANKFGYLLVQNIEGRIVPINTQALEVLRKLHKRDKFKGSDGKYLTANQWFLAVNMDPQSWALVPLIKINLGGDVLKKKVKANEDGYTSLMNLFPTDANGNMHYVLEEDYKEAFGKKPAEQSKYDLAVIDLNDRVQAFNEFFSGQFMRVVPVKNDSNSTWHSWMTPNFEPDLESQAVLGPYFVSVMDAQKKGSWDKADSELKNLMDYQQKWGKNVVPEPLKVDTEVFLNGVDINFKLLIYYTFIGFILAILGFIVLFSPKKIINTIIKYVLALGALGWFLQFLGLIGRWYISGHAPWSNGYEAIIFISWVGITAGFSLYRNSNALIPAAGFLVAVIMMGFAHGGSALDPQITPLVPVLKSYWLIVHVAIITSSYGFFGLSFVIAVITLLFYSIAGKTAYQKHKDSTIKELSIVSEMSLTIGLYALTIGTFMGGIWANESWGRYWSWDPKETWAFISVMVYAIVLHMRLVPGLRGKWSFHVASMFAICSVIMTYFGVNYYLSGLHSYAAGDPVPIPAWVYIGISSMIVLATVSYFKHKQFMKQQ